MDGRILEGDFAFKPEIEKVIDNTGLGDIELLAFGSKADVLFLLHDAALDGILLPLGNVAVIFLELAHTRIVSYPLFSSQVWAGSIVLQ